MTEKERKRQATIIERYGSLEAYREMIKKAGAKGGKTKGESKVRGDREYYSQTGKKGAEKRWRGGGK